MTGARVTVTFDDKAFVAGMDRLIQLGQHPTPLLRAMGTALVEVVQRRFEDGREPFGAKFTRLNPAYAEIKRGPGILRASGMLQRSITFEVAHNQVSVGSNRVYAAIHQFGGTIKPKNAKALVFKLAAYGPRGGLKRGTVFARSVRIPQRPYLGFGPNDQRAVMDVLEEAIERALRAS